MRSRYSAFVVGDINYLKSTTWPAKQKRFDAAGYADRMANSIWLGLTVHEAIEGEPEDTIGYVTFTAKSMINAQVHEQHEKSLFRKKNGQWYYVREAY